VIILPEHSVSEAQVLGQDLWLQYFFEMYQQTFCIHFCSV
jgi:hypothetical protein